MPPLVIFDRKNLRPEYTVGEVPGTLYGLSKNGWIDSELFELWFNHHFLAHAPPMRPVLLLMDGHSSHFNPSVIKKAADERVVLFCLPPHTTHLTQPLDKGCFGPLKMHWRRECWTYVTNNPDRLITRYQFSALFGQAWFKGMTMQNIISGFRTTGIYPLDRSALLPANEFRDKRESLAQQKGLNFIPLYSPRSRPYHSDVVNPAVLFTPEEIARFEHRYEEGYDIPDERYQKWLSLYHPDSLTCDHPTVHQSEQGIGYGSPESYDSPTSPADDRTYQYQSEHENLSQSPQYADISHPEPLEHTSVLSRVITKSAPQIKCPDFAPRNMARVLTSAENLDAISTKERKKRAEREEKEKRRIAREQKRVKVQEEKERKRRAREEKLLEKQHKSRSRRTREAISKFKCV